MGKDGLRSPASFQFPMAASPTAGAGCNAAAPRSQTVGLESDDVQHGAGCAADVELDEGEHHDHLVCLQCGHVEEFFDAEIEKRQHKIAKDRGFALQDHSLSLYANCMRPNCEYRNAERARTEQHG